MKKFEIGKTADMPKFNAWFNFCSNEQIPYIIVKNKIKYSTIEWDHINLNPELDKKFAENSEEHRKELLSIFDKFADSKSKYTISNLTFIVDGIPIKHSSQFAEELFDALIKRIDDY